MDLLVVDLAEQVLNDQNKLGIKQEILLSYTLNRFAIQGLERQYMYLKDQMCKFCSAIDEEQPVGAFRKFR